jgi:predicted dehydrogenase
MKESPILGVGLWGLGKHAIHRVLPAIRSSETVRLVGVTSRNATTGSKTAETFGCLYWNDPSEMLRDPDIEVVYLSTPIGLHGKMGECVLRAGRHLWCEKSLTNSFEESTQLISLARQKDLALCETLMYQYHPQFDRLKDIVFSSDFGKIISLTSRFTIPELDQPGFRDSLELGGGAFFDVGCYPISLASELLGKDLTVDFAELENDHTSEVDLRGRAVLKSKLGSIAFLEWGMGLAYRNEVTICGKRKSLYADRIFSKNSDQLASLQIRNHYGTPSEEIISHADYFALMIDMVARGVWDRNTRQDFWDDIEGQAILMNRVGAGAF